MLTQSYVKISGNINRPLHFTGPDPKIFSTDLVLQISGLESEVVERAGPPKPVADKYLGVQQGAKDQKTLPFPSN